MNAASLPKILSSSVVRASDWLLHKSIEWFKPYESWAWFLQLSQSLVKIVRTNCPIFMTSIICCFLELVFSCVAIFVLAALYEGLKVLREVLKRRYSYLVSVDLTETKVYGTGPNQTAVVTESKGQLPRYCINLICN